MRAAFGHFAVLNHEDAVGAADGGKAVRDDEGRAPLERGNDGLLNLLLRFGIDGGGGLVQHEDGGPGDQRAGEGDQLLLSRGKAVSALADVGIIALLELQDEILRVDQPGGLLDFLVGRVQTAIADVLADGAGEQVRLLKHIAQMRLKPQLRALAVVHAVDQDASLGRLIEAADQVYDGALSAARFAHQRDGLARLHVQVEVLQHLFAAGIPERHVLKPNIAL